MEMDFFLRTLSRLVPVEVKATNGRAKSLSTLINSDHYGDIDFGVKLTAHFSAFLLPRLLADEAR